MITLDLSSFRSRFPEFSSDADAVIERYWDMAICYISDQDYGFLSGDCRELAIQQMTAHLLKMAAAIDSGDTTGLVVSATIDKVSVSLQPPPGATQWRWWLSLTVYGQQLLGLLQAKSAGGFFVGGMPENSSFRKVYGRF